MIRRGKSVSRVLYAYRTPPDIKVGREPFDEAVRRALEAQNPEVRFDWRQILETPIPSADAEKWRERRRAERSERAARQAADREDDDAAAADEQRTPDVPMHVLERAASAGETVVEVSPAIDPLESVEVQPDGDATSIANVIPRADVTHAADSAHVADTPPRPPSGRRRRNRRRRRGGHGPDRPAGTSTITDPAAPAVAAGEKDAPAKEE